MGKLDATRGTVHSRKVPRLKADTGRMEAIKEPPTEAYRELAKVGLLPIQGPRIRTDWCRCSHQLGAHAKDGGPCEAKACRKFAPCPGYRHDPRYDLEGPTGTYATGTGRMTEVAGEDGTVHLEFTRGAADGDGG